MRSGLLLFILVMLGGTFSACRTERGPDATVPYTTEVKPLLDVQCVRCHAGSAPAGGYGASSYLDAIGCTASGMPATVVPSNGSAPLLAALDRADHAGFASSAQRETLGRWITTGTSRSGGGVHPARFADPRAPDSHIAFLRARRYAPLIDAHDADACGACHDATGTGGDSRGFAANAPACSTCHTEPGAALACGTCHGDGAHAFPPRNRCFFPNDPAGGAHAAHGEASAIRATPLPCSACHPSPATGSFGGTHANGHVEIWLDFALAGRTATWDATDQRCTGTCHAHGGKRPTPTWSESGPLGCNDCHLSPPPSHYGGSCTSCHREANADGTGLVPGLLHVNGKVDLGDGSGGCGACHGTGSDPWPTTGAHQAHAHPADARPVPCESCHAVPRSGDRHPLGTGKATVRFASTATTGGSPASYDPVTKTCASTYCHESRGGQEIAPVWTGRLTAGCTSCHSSPPPPPHTQSAACGGSTCHDGLTDGLTMTPLGRLTHVNGLIERSTP